MYINLSPGQTYNNILNVTLPDNGLVPGSEYIEVTAIGTFQIALNALKHMLFSCSGSRLIVYLFEAYTYAKQDYRPEVFSVSPRHVLAEYVVDECN